MDKLWPWLLVAYFRVRKVACEKRVHCRVHPDIVCQMICTSFIVTYCLHLLFVIMNHDVLPDSLIYIFSVICQSSKYPPFPHTSHPLLPRRGLRRKHQHKLLFTFPLYFTKSVPKKYFMKFYEDCSDASNTVSPLS